MGVVGTFMADCEPAHHRRDPVFHNITVREALNLMSIRSLQVSNGQAAGATPASSPTSGRLFPGSIAFAQNPRRRRALAECLCFRRSKETMKKRPLSVTIAGYVIVAAASWVSPTTLPNGSSVLSTPKSSGSRCSACSRLSPGVAMLRGHNWGRWLTLVWIAFHVVVSYWHGWPEVAMHAALLALFAYILFRPAANAYFQPPRMD